MREILLIRHAIAEDLDISADSGQKDEDRALTKKGCDRMADVAKGLKIIVPTLSYLASSPLLRATQTAEIIAREYQDLRVINVDVLQPGVDFRSFSDWLAQLPDTGPIAMVGHEPDVSQLTCRLLADDAHLFLHFKKGAACLIETPDLIEEGNAHMKWFLTPKQLRRIGNRK